MDKDKIIDGLITVIDNPNTNYNQGLELAQVDAIELVLANIDDSDERAVHVTEKLQIIATAGVTSFTARVRAAKVLLGRKS